MTGKESRENRQKRVIRIICLALAVVMGVTIIASAVLSNLW